MANPLYDALFAPHAGSVKPFLHLQDGGPDAGIVTYGQFVELAARYATLFFDLGLKPGDRVLLQAEKSPQALAVYAACVQSGMVFLPLNTAYTPAEVEYFASDSQASLMICAPASADAHQKIATAVGAKLLTLGVDGSGSLSEAASKLLPEQAATPREIGHIAALLYTSGTTGRSKGAMLTQENLLSNALTLVDAWRFTGEDVLLHALPIFHTHGLFVATNVMLLAGGAMIFLPGLDVEQLIIGMPRATTLMGVPTFYTRLLADPRLTQELTAHMRLFISGSAPLLAETHRAFTERTGHRILERYGMTETNMNTSNPYDGERRAGTVGCPLPGVDLHIANPETGEPLPRGQIGVIEVKGPNVFAGYWRMPEKTRAEFRADGHFITGDLGTMDETGYVTIVGRAKDLIIAGGYNIYPKEIELLLDAEPGVIESAVIGVPHPDLGEAVVAIVASRDDRLTPETLLSAIHDRLARFKQPRRIVIIDQLPRNTMGKVQKNVLRTQYQDSFKAQPGSGQRSSD